MAKKSKYIGCLVKDLPDEEQEAAAAFACKCNPTNAPQMQTLAKMGIVLSPQHISVVTTKWWGPAGVDHSVSFLSQASAALQEKILSHMNAWGQPPHNANVKFRITGGAAQNADLRISLGQGGFYSYLGTDNGRIPRNQQTMNLQGFSLNTPLAEYLRVVRHEVGHHLGCPHEHMRKEIVDKIVTALAEAYFRRTQGWTPQQVQQQVKNIQAEATLMGKTLHADVFSIMCYGLPGEIMSDGIAVPGGTDINAEDGRNMALVYPKSVIVQPPVTDGLEISIPKVGKWRWVA